MIIEDGTELYHGSYTEVAVVDLGKCKDGLDFGKGFYLTSDYEQAVSYVPSAVRKAVRARRVKHNYDVNDGRISVYRYHADKSLNIHCFTEADLDWLHFVTANRDKDFFPEVLDKYRKIDIVCGKIADDQTARTLQAYIAGAYGMPGEKQTDETAIKILLPNRLKNQFCFRTENSVSALEFIGSVRYGDR